MDLLSAYSEEDQISDTPFPVSGVYIESLDRKKKRKEDPGEQDGDERKKRRKEERAETQREEKGSDSGLPDPLELLGAANPDYLTGANFNGTHNSSLQDVLKPSELTLMKQKKEQEQEREQELKTAAALAESLEEEKKKDDFFDDPARHKKGVGIVIIESGAKPIKTAEKEILPPPPKRETRTQKEKKKVKGKSQTGWRTESTSGRWKTDEEMRMRQQFH